MSRDSFLKRTYSNSYGVSHRRAKRQERERAKKHGGRLVPGSGNGAIKGDIAKDQGLFRIEAKTTRRMSFSVTRKMIEVLEESALPHGEIPAVLIEFQAVDGHKQRTLVVIPAEYLKPGLVEEDAERDS